MVMSFSPFDIAMQQYKGESKTPQEPQTSSSNFSPMGQDVKYGNDPAQIATNPFNIAQQVYTGQKDESWWDATLRNITRTGSRMVETVLGLPGDVANFAKDMLVQFPSSAGIAGKAIENTIGKEGWERMVRGNPGT